MASECSPHQLMEAHACGMPVPASARLTLFMRAMYTAAFSPDGSQVLTACADCFARLFNARTGICELKFEGHNMAVHGASFSPDGRLVLTSSDDRAARLFSASSGRCLQVFEGHGDHLYMARFSPDASSVLTASDDCTAKLFHIE